MVEIPKIWGSLGGLVSPELRVARMGGEGGLIAYTDLSKAPLYQSALSAFTMSWAGGNNMPFPKGSLLSTPCIQWVHSRCLKACTASTE